MKEIKEVKEKENTRAAGAEAERGAERGDGVPREILPPMVFVSADSKGVVGGKFVSADSKGVISRLFSADTRGSVSADSKGVTEEIGKW
ncbi:MAG TPA: hypothetical protein VJN93_18340 [Candidatus Acidoferrum sp.]|nr:hypothetical protein [Candidatus Acidoferrum sp.]